VVYPGLGAGFRALDWLDVGAAAQLRYFRARQVQSIYSLGGQSSEITDIDAVASADARETARLVFGLGAIDPYPAPAVPIGNGEYQTFLDIVAFQVAASL
jgi:hypothetical protein